ncbi:hypothetical protein CBE89_00035 [Corynebacterium striatum]|uniref:Uncharacterized protein n=1 Tax=Corynebacterium striatum TaxID=43770 RepID=A0A2Z2J132_CORST|nr:hypothetical protein CBE89_00035 [Corynebacterium striatum]
MVNAAILFEPGWTHCTYAPFIQEDPDTGEPYTTRQAIETPGKGLVQAPLWSGFQETTKTTVRDERLVLFQSDQLPETFGITAEDEFFSPQGHCWQAITDGMPRRIPGKNTDYYAVRVRREKGKDHG